MTVVEVVLELLRVHRPDFEIDQRWERRRSPPPAPAPPHHDGRPRGRRAGAREQRRGGGATRRRTPTLAACYATLEVAPGADLRTVRRAWLRLVRKHHPDLCGGDAERQRLGTEVVKQLNFAYEEIRKHLQQRTS